jgi:hypothetical protein
MLKFGQNMFPLRRIESKGSELLTPKLNRATFKPLLKLAERVKNGAKNLKAFFAFPYQKDFTAMAKLLRSFS